MKKDEIEIGDLQRILLGEAPVHFLAEVLIRSIITYVILLVVLKLLGKRMSGRLTNTEMAVMLMFGAVVSSAMQIPDRGVIEGAFVLFLILALQRLLTLWTIKQRKLEKITLGTTSLIVKDGLMLPQFLEKELLSHNQLNRKLRAKHIYQLGEVKRVYMETNGSFTIIKEKKPIPGLSVLPDEDKPLQSLFETHPEITCCSNCGKPYPTSHLPESCDNCLHHQWKPSVIKKT